MDPTVLFVFLLGVFMLSVSAVMARHATRPQNNPAATLRRCKMALWAIKRELSQMEATREIYELVEDCEKSEVKVQRLEAGL